MALGTTAFGDKLCQLKYLQISAYTVIQKSSKYKLPITQERSISRASFRNIHQDCFQMQTLPKTRLQKCTNNNKTPNKYRNNDASLNQLYIAKTNKKMKTVNNQYNKLLPGRDFPHRCISMQWALLILTILPTAHLNNADCGVFAS